MFKYRLISSLILLGLVSALVAFEQKTWSFALIAFLGLCAQWEFYGMQKSKGLKVFSKGGVGCGLIFLAAVYLQVVYFEDDGSPALHGLESLAILLILLGAFTRQVFEENQETPVATVGLTLLGFFYIPYLFSFVPKILLEDSGFYNGIYMALYLIVVTKVTDMGAYLIGSKIGRNKMSPRISPKKTWEGFAGGVAAALLASVLMAWILPTSLRAIQGVHAWVLGLLLPVVSVVGDLAESVIKRDAQSKDSGAIIPGIGGALDLIDSLLFTAPLLYLYLLFLTPS